MRTQLFTSSLLSICLLSSGALAKSHSEHNMKTRGHDVEFSSSKLLNPRVKIKSIIASDGSERVMVDGEDLCDEDLFRIRVTDNVLDETSWYTSGSGRSTWKIKKGADSGRCTVDMQLARDILLPGKTIEVRTYRENSRGEVGEKVNTFRYNIPCTKEEFTLILSSGFDIIAGVFTTTNSCTGTSSDSTTIVGVAPAPTPAAPVQHCSSKVSSAVNSAQISYQCDLNDDVDVTVIDKSTMQTICLERFKAAVSDSRPACAIPRNPLKTMNLDVQIDSRSGRYVQSHIIAKDATFTSAPQANILSGKEINITATSGLIVDKKWNTTIKAQVFDADMNRDEGRALIKVELVHKINGSMYFLRKGVMANTGDVVSFSLEKTYSKPGFFSSGGEGGDNLNMGRNELFIRVHDAYSIDEMKFVDIPVIVNLQ